MAIRSNKPLIIMLTLALLSAVGAGVWGVIQLRRPLEARQNPTVLVAQPNKEIVSRYSQFEFVFDQKMDHDSVLNALIIEPAFAYDAEWQEEGDGERLLLTPINPLESEYAYQVTLSKMALNQEGRPLDQEIVLSLTTSQEIEVIDVSPAAASEMVALNEPITIQFDQPIHRALANAETPQHEEQDNMPLQVVLEPATPGVGQWIDEETYRFFPATSLQAGTEYQVTLTPMITGHMELKEAYHWSFMTEGARVQASFPFNGAIEVGRSSDIRLQFAQPMDAKQTQASFKLNQEGQASAIEGKFTWKDEKTLYFQPNQPLAMAATYQIELNNQAATPGGVRGLASPYRASFTTVEPLQVESVQPITNTIEVSLIPTDTLIAVQFNRPIVPLVGLADKEALPIPITIEPALSGEGEWVTTRLFVYRPTETLIGSREYTVTVSNEVVDTLGASLQEAFSWRFTTEYPRALQLEPLQEPDQSLPPIDIFETKSDNSDLSETSSYLIASDGPISIRFNQAMEPTLGANAFALYDRENNSVEGKVNWQENDTLLQFVPTNPLNAGAEYRVTFADGAPGATGGQTKAPFERLIAVASPLQVVERYPTEEEEEVPPQSSITIGFNTPLNAKDIESYIQIEPQPKQLFTSYNPSGNQLYLSFGQGLQPNTTYTLTLSENLPDLYGGTLSEAYEFTFTTGALSPHLRLASNRVGGLGTLNPTVPPIQVVDYRNLSQIDFSLYRFTETELQEVYNQPAWQEYRGNPAQLVTQWSITPSEETNQSVLAQTELPLAPEERNGLYFLYVTTPDRDPSVNYILEDKVILLFSPLNLTVKQAPNELVVWATDMQAGQPQAEVRIQAIDSNKLELVGEGLTDEQGLLRLPLPFTDEPNGNRSFMVKSYQADGTLSSIATPEWAGEAGPWAFGYRTEWVPLRLYGSLYSERPIYRPGHTIYYKGILRERKGRDFGSVNIEKMEVRLEFQGEIVASQEVEVGQFGSFDGNFTLDEDAPTGYYYLKLWQEELGYCFPSYCYWESIESQIQVAEYERPTFEVDVESNQPAIVQGEAAQATVLATYYAGGTLSDAPVSWNQFSRDYYFDVPGLAGYWNWQDHEGGSIASSPFGFEPPSPDPLAKYGSTVLDESGQTILPLTIDLAPVGQAESETGIIPRSRTLIIESEVTDIDERVVSGRDEMVIHAGEFYIGLRSDSYLGRVGDSLLFHIATADIEGNLEGPHEVTLEFYQREWGSESDGFAFSRNRTFTDTLISSEQLTTTQTGRTVNTFTPPAGGTYTVLAHARDTSGNEIRSRAHFWVIEQSESALWGITDDNRMELTADKKSYEVGDVAKILLPTNMAGMTALISQELFEIETLSVQELATTAEVIEIPITEEMVPNVYLSVVALSGTSDEQPAPEFRMGYLNIPVSIAPKKLQLYVTPSERENNAPPQPGETVTFNVYTQDANQEPISAEVSLAMVDKAVLALAEDNQLSLLDAFYRQAPLAVRTGTSLAINIDRVNDTAMEAESARTLGGGGGGGGGGMIESSLRSNILDTAYWQADIVTDAQGKAEVSITLPDNLTTWTLIAKAVTEEGPLVGEYEGDLLTTKPLLIDPHLPRFLVMGDEATIPVIVHNNTADTFDAVVRIESDELTVINERPIKEVFLPPNGRQVVYFTVRPNEISSDSSENQAKQIKVAFDVKGAGLSDGIEKHLPLYDWVSPDIVASSGVIRQPEEALIETIQLPEGRITSQGGLTLELIPSLAGVTDATLKWLDTYPYQNTEAIASRLLVNAATLEALQMLPPQRSNPTQSASEERLSSEIAAQAKLLAEWQNEDGGWTWWAKSSESVSTPWLTAYTLFALHKSQIVAIESSSDALTQAIPYVQMWLDTNALTPTHDSFDTHAFMLYVLSQIQHDGAAELDINRLNELAQTLVKQRTPDLTSHDGLTFLLMTLINTGAPDEMRRTLASELLSHARLSATGAHWEEEHPNPVTLDSSLRSTALAIRALSRLQVYQEEDNMLDLLPQGIKWLMNARQNGRWQNTQESAWAVLALTEYMLASGELEANFDYQLMLNGEVRQSGEVTPESLTEATILEIAISDLLQNEANQLGIVLLPSSNQQETNGQLYYSTWLRTYLSAEELEATSQGIQVTRHYESVDPNTLQSTGAPIESVAVGELVQVRIRVDTPNSLHFFTLEDPIPAGFEIVDPSLLTTPANVSGPTQVPISDTQSRFYYNQWSQKVIRDEKIALFSDLLPSGSYEYTYLLRATTAGTYHALPTLAYETYHPEVFGRSKGEEVVIRLGR